MPGGARRLARRAIFLQPSLCCTSERHARAWRGHPRLNFPDAAKTWMAGTSPAMTERERFDPMGTAAWRCEKGPAGGSQRGQVEGGNAQAGDGRTPTIITDRSVTSPAYEGRAGTKVKQLTLEGWTGRASPLARHARAWRGHPRLSDLNEDVDGRDKPGHDEYWNVTPLCRAYSSRFSDVPKTTPRMASDLDLLVLDHAFDRGARDHAVLERGVVLELCHR
jgi:hypothetical protein